MNGQNLSKVCFLCEQPAAVAGCFIPKDPRLWGEGKSRGIWYVLCEGHFNNGHPPVEEIEMKMAAPLPGVATH